ncbi:M23 family metallopeptidase [Rickettsiales endosymbiont of Stachyamoeba lipophora]|uniref:M23 family metallopeptidase n=1 Tax=Rickettsiales endosymbiont of Stachyamoeba lipophora TaxID=2486578 RepID=UPI000F64EEC7|nr:M23 family metallopeptidase [Rickettsiales endosymbiont of Stachyamoeba lipophora]AZL16201.1 M23 family metallopeptidase [Rickettsiales endosymbiont of Stachyamoeba lipophora]
MKYLLLIFITYILSSCVAREKNLITPKLKARKQFEREIAQTYGKENARNIIKYDLLTLNGDGCLISPLFTNAYSPLISVDTYEKHLNAARIIHRNLSEAQKADNSYAKLTLLANFYNLNHHKLKINSTKANPKQYSLKKLLRYGNKFNKKLRSIPIVAPLQNLQVSSNYGLRVHPINKTNSYHHGIDLISKHDYIYAAGDAKVIFAGDSNGYGNLVKLYHGNNIYTYYAHLAKIYVTKGALIGAGQVIGLMGATGNAAGKHLHYEVRVKDKTVNPAFLLYKNC